MCGRAAVIRRGATLAAAVGARRIINGEAESRKRAKETHTTAALTTSTSSAAPHITYEVNYNCAPTSTMPVWRLQTAEEQKELKSALHDATAAHVDGGSAAAGGGGESGFTTAGGGDKRSVDLALLVDDSSSSSSSSSSVPVIQYMTFGMPNPVPGASSSMFNARSETLEEKVTFQPMLSKRCCVLVDGFYEFHTEQSTSSSAKQPTHKQAYLFHQPIKGNDKEIEASKANMLSKKDGESPFPIMYLAGIYDATLDDLNGAVKYAFVILTGAPSKAMAPIHNRQPIVLSPEDAKKWIDVDNYKFSQVKYMLKPYEGLSFYKTSPVVNSSRNHGIDCLEPLEYVEKRKSSSGMHQFFSRVSSPPSSSSISPNIAQSSSPSSTPPSSAASSTASTSAPIGQSVDAHDVIKSDVIDPSISSTSVASSTSLYPANVNPADTGLTIGGNQSTMNDSSDASRAAEQFVQSHMHVKDESDHTIKRKHDDDDEQKKNEDVAHDDAHATVDRKKQRIDQQ